MTEHTWTQIEHDLGRIGIDVIWVCEGCGAQGGPVLPEYGRKPSREPYIRTPHPTPGSSTTMPIAVSLDCDEARVQVQAAAEARKEAQEFRDSMPSYLDPRDAYDRTTWREMGQGSLRAKARG